METVMKAMGIAALPQVADLHPLNAFAPMPRRVATAAPRPSFLQRILTWHRVANERRRLLELDERTLRDIGLTPDDAVREASRPFWDTGR
jgi:uncharacterized protein YjiS (DUF1127 family)